MPSLSALAQDLTPNLPRKGTPIHAKTTELYGLIVHHEVAETVWDLARRQIKTQDSIGYHYVVEESGLICLSLEAGYRGHHDYYQRGDDIRKFPNRDPLHYDDHYLGLAVLAEDANLIKEKQVESLVQLAQAFLTIDPKFKILGHKEVPGKTHVHCPGEGFSMEYVRAEAKRRIGAAGTAPTTWMDSFTNPKAAAVATKGLLDSRETMLLRARDRLRESTLGMQAAVGLLIELEREINRELDK